LIKLVEFDNKEYLYYKAIAPDIAFIRATTCDSEGYATFEDEVMYLDALVIAQAVHNNGGIVMMQVQKMVKKATLHPKSVRIPGYLVDIVVVDPDQTQLYGGAPVNRFISGDFTLDDSTKLSLPLNQRKLVARRALFEMRKGAVGNVGVGIADGIGLVAREEGCADDFILTVETGPIGGITSQGIAFGANVNTRAILDMTSQFDFYHGGGLDVCYLSFAEVDQHGNVGVHKFNGKIMGTGGFIDISATSKKIVFCGTLIAGSLKTEITDGKLNIVQEGRVKKFIRELPEITFSGKIALERGLDVRYITERAVFTLKEDGLHLIEIAPGVDLQKDILDKMDFTPVISPELKLMDERLFIDAAMGFVLPEAAH
ncbi:acetate CoA-transferase YdiF, partial [Escherichia coli]